MIPPGSGSEMMTLDDEEEKRGEILVPINLTRRLVGNEGGNTCHDKTEFPLSSFSIIPLRDYRLIFL